MKPFRIYCIGGVLWLTFISIGWLVLPGSMPAPVESHDDPLLPWQEGCWKPLSEAASTLAEPVILSEKKEPAALIRGSVAVRGRTFMLWQDADGHLHRRSVDQHDNDDGAYRQSSPMTAGNNSDEGMEGERGVLANDGNGVPRCNATGERHAGIGYASSAGRLPAPSP